MSEQAGGTISEQVIWHDLECGRYAQDLPLWLSLAREHGDPVLDVGAGTGRVALRLADAGFDVVALDHDPELLAELARRDRDRRVECVRADARDFDLGDRRFPLIIVPMQTIQLLGGAAGHGAFLARARAHLARDGIIAIAIALAADFEEFQWQAGHAAPLPDVAELDGAIFSSQPIAVRRQGASLALERRREHVDPTGGRRVAQDRIELDVLTATEIEQAGQRAGLRSAAVRRIAATGEHIASEVVILGG